MVTKCFNARPKTKELGVSICLMYIEIERQETVLVSLLLLIALCNKVYRMEM